MSYHYGQMVLRGAGNLWKNHVEHTLRTVPPKEEETGKFIHQLLDPFGWDLFQVVESLTLTGCPTSGLTKLMGCWKKPPGRKAERQKCLGGKFTVYMGTVHRSYRWMQWPREHQLGHLQHLLRINALKNCHDSRHGEIWIHFRTQLLFVTGSKVAL